LISRSEPSYSLCLIACDLQTLTMRRPRKEEEENDEEEEEEGGGGGGGEG